MAENKIRDIFNGRYFEIPKYQRGYAWEVSHVRDLFDDVSEAIETNSQHFLGTLVLSQNEAKTDRYYVVDGQQRITTIMFFINELTKHLPKSDRIFYRRFYIEEDGSFRLKSLGRDDDYLRDLLRGKSNEPHNKSQSLMKAAYEEVRTKIDKLQDKKLFLKQVEKLEVMEFIEKSEGDAIRIFQTVNDRGKLLSNMEKAKSLLIYFSNRYLKKKYDDRINTIFGDIFEEYDQIKHIGDTEGINLISSTDFNEDSVMRYHFLTFSDEYYDATAGYVLGYLKRKLAEFRAQGKPGLKNMEHFIESYCESLLEFFVSLSNVMKRVKRDPKYYKFFVLLGPSTYLYPIIVKLDILGKLDSKLPAKKLTKYTFLDMLELIDIRVYKTKGTDPRADISRLAFELNSSWTNEAISDWLLDYNRDWMPKGAFDTYLAGEMYGNRALPYIFVNYCEQTQGTPFTLSELENLHATSPTIEHILSKTPKFTFKSVGFRSGDDFEAHKDQVGNLTIIEKSINSAVQNKMPVEKVLQYDKSSYRMTKILASQIDGTKKFVKNDLATRTQDLAQFISEKWWC